MKNQPGKKLTILKETITPLTQHQTKMVKGGVGRPVITGKTKPTTL